MDFKKDILKLLKAQKIKATEDQLETPPNPKMGDYAFPCFTLAKQFKKAPPLIAQDLAKKIKLKPPIKEIKPVGPYLNFFVDKSILTEKTLKLIAKEKDNYGQHKSTKKKIIIEYPSPNTNKPLHLGHIRNLLIGSSVSQLFKKTGNKVIQANMNNDRGIHICKSMLAYQKWGKNSLPEDEGMKSDHFVGKWYVKFCKAAKENPSLEKEAQVMLQKWEAGDKEVRKLWKLMNAWAFGGFEETYERMGIFFDKYYYESEYYDNAKNIIKYGLKKKVFEKDKDGAILINFEKDKDKKVQQWGKKFVLRPDGTSIYITQDLYLAQLKYKDYAFDQSIHVVAHEQDYHFQVLFKILEKLGFKWATKNFHLSYGMVHLPHGRMKSREGTAVDADDLLSNMEDLAKVEIRKRHADVSKVVLGKRAIQIGHAALRFFILKVDHQRDVTFNPEESISFEGETGPYVQYAHARICSMLKKYKKKPSVKVKFDKLVAPQEVHLTKLLGQFPDVLLDAANHYRPSTLCHYLIEVSQAFSEFYAACPILKAKPELQDARMLLAYCTRIVLHQGLHVLGIDAPEEM